MNAPSRLALLGALALPLLAGCGNRSVMGQAPTAPCPRVALLAEAVDYTKFRDGAVPDVATVEVDARLAGFQARCDYAPRGAGLDVSIQVQVSAERGPAGGRTAGIPFLVAVLDGPEGQVLSRATDTVAVAFEGNARSAPALGPEMVIRLPGDIQRASERSVVIGFRLTPEQLALNRRRGVR